MLDKFSSENVKAAVVSRFNIDDGHVEPLIADVFHRMVKDESLAISFSNVVVRAHATNIGKSADKVTDKFVSVLRELGYEVTVSGSSYPDQKNFNIRAL